MTGRKPVYVGKTNSAILAGDIDVSEWSDEELLRGQRLGRNGRWMGRRPKVVPTKIHDELVRRRFSEAAELLRENLVEAVKVLISLATNPEVEDSVRLKASQIVIERVMGKAVEKVNIRIDEAKPWESALQVIIIGEEQDAIQHVIEAQAIGVGSDDEDDDDYDPFNEDV